LGPAGPCLRDPHLHGRAARPRAKAFALSEGDAHVIRNAGGRASEDAIRSLAISHKLLGTREWFVVHHTNCGMGVVAARMRERARVTGQTEAGIAS
jgi:carbonic anhydrase